MSDSSNLYPQDLWNEGYRDLGFRIAPESDQVRRWLEKWAAGRKGSCLEVGCFPGQYLAALGKLGFELNGIDLAPRTDREMVQWLSSCGYKTGAFTREDFFSHDFGRRFDLVYSVGFIEHFTDWRAVLRRQAELVAPGGLLLVNTPNFSRGFQKAFHRLFDRENLERHNLDSMDPGLWAEELRREGFEILDLGFFDEFEFWVGVQKRNLLQKLGFWGLRAARPALARVIPRGMPGFAPYCVLAAVKKGN